MTDIRRDLMAEAKRLEELRVVIEKKLGDLPDLSTSRLRITTQQQKVRYYLCERGKAGSGRYLPEGGELAAMIAQHDYYLQVDKVLKKQLDQIYRFIKSYHPEDLIRAYEILNEARKILIEPVVDPDPAFISKWLAEPFEKKKMDSDSVKILTNNGENVRSKSEKILADKFASMGIPYKYEKPLQLSAGYTFYPDFTLLNVRLRRELYWEHLGMMDDPDYIASTARKMSIYEKSGIMPFDELLISWETKTYPLDMEIVEIMIYKYLL